MLTRYATSIIVTSFLLFSGLVQAKVAPSLDVPSQTRDAILQQLINQPQDANSCELSDLRTPLHMPKVSDQFAVTMVLEHGQADLCPITAPPADPFGDVTAL